MSIGASSRADEAMHAAHASAESLVIGPEQRPSEPMVVFYRLARKFVDDERSVPQDETSSQILYYTLSVGHHTGIIDCFDECLSCTLPCYEAACALLPEGSHARYKMEGILRSGEIQVLHEEVAELLDAARSALAQGDGKEPSEAREWLEGFARVLEEIQPTKAAYLMGRERLP
jgi:hypothetical protein